MRPQFQSIHQKNNRQNGNHIRIQHGTILLVICTNNNQEDVSFAYNGFGSFALI